MTSFDNIRKRMYNRFEKFLCSKTLNVEPIKERYSYFEIENNGIGIQYEFKKIQW
jgi:hypothetical protein